MVAPFFIFLIKWDQFICWNAQKRSAKWNAKAKMVTRDFFFFILGGPHSVVCDIPIMPKPVPFVYNDLLSIFKYIDNQPFIE